MKSPLLLLASFALAAVASAQTTVGVTGNGRFVTPYPSGDPGGYPGNIDYDLKASMSWGPDSNTLSTGDGTFKWSQLLQFDIAGADVAAFNAANSFQLEIVNGPSGTGQSFSYYASTMQLRDLAPTADPQDIYNALGGAGSVTTYLKGVVPGEPGSPAVYLGSYDTKPTGGSLTISGNAAFDKMVRDTVFSGDGNPATLDDVQNVYVFVIADDAAGAFEGPTWVGSTLTALEPGAVKVVPDDNSEVVVSVSLQVTADLSSAFTDVAEADLTVAEATGGVVEATVGTGGASELFFRFGEAKQLSSIVNTGTSTRTREDGGVYINAATSNGTLAYGWADPNLDWKTFWSFDLDADDNGINELAGATSVTLGVDFANVPGDSEYRLVFSDIEDEAIAGNGTSFPWQGQFDRLGDIDEVTAGDQTWIQDLSQGQTAETYDVSWLSGLSVEALNNVAHFRVESTAADFASSAGARFTNTGAPITPTLTAVFPLGLGLGDLGAYAFEVPGDAVFSFKIQISADGVSYVDVPDADLTVEESAAGEVVLTIDAGDPAPAELFLRIVAD
jgi:hypothetical protein